jgi:hypothetical protein
MVVLKRGASKARMKSILDKITSSNIPEFDAHHFCGILKLKSDALRLQKEMRDEWD